MLATDTDTPASESESNPEDAGLSQRRSTARWPAASPSMHKTTRLLLEYLVRCGAARSRKMVGRRVIDHDNTTARIQREARRGQRLGCAIHGSGDLNVRFATVDVVKILLYIKA